MKYAPPRLWGITAVVTVVCVLGVITDIAVVQCREDDLLLTDRQRGPPAPHGRNHVGPRDTRRSTNDRATPRDDVDGVSSPPSAAPPPPDDVYREDADGPTPTAATSRQQMVDPTCPIPEQQSEMNSFLWRISHPASPNTRPSYMFGTIHVPYARVWDHIPDNTKEALDEADAVYFELDLTNPHTIAMLANCQMLPAGEELHNILPPDLYRRLKRHLKYVKQEMPHWVTSAQQGHGLYADYMFNALTSNWQRKRPVWVMLMVNSLTENDVKSRGIPVLDLYLAQEAARLGKRTGSLERVEEQCLPLNALNLSQVVFALNKTLSQHETYRRGGQWTSVGTEQLIYHYNCGDLNEVIFSHDTARVPNLLNFTLSYNDTVIARKIDQYFRKELIYKRNRRIASRVDDLMQIHHNETYVFACGAGHFIGNNTVLDNLVNLGYTIEHIAAGQPLHPGSSKQKKKGSNSFRHGLPSAPIIISGDLDRIDPFYNRRKNRHRKNRHRGRNKKGRRRNRGGTHTGGGAPHEAQGGPLNGPTDSDRLSRPQFNELWVRIEASSFGPNSYFRHRLSPAPPLFPGLDAGMTPFPPHLAPGGGGIVGGREDQSPSVSDGSHVDSSAPHNNMLSSAAASSSSRDLAASSVLSALCATCLLVLYVVAWKLAHR